MALYASAGWRIELTTSYRFFVKVVDPEQTQKNDKRDNNDCKEKKNLRVRSKKDRGGTAETVEDDLRNITGRANSSLNSRKEATIPSIPPNNVREKAQSPAESNKRSTISIRLQDKLAANSVNSSLSISDAPGLKLKVKQKNVENSMSRTGMKSPNNERVEYRERERERERE